MWPKLSTRKSTGRKFQEGLDVDGKTILEWILNKYEEWIVSAKVRDRWKILESPNSINHGVVSYYNDELKLVHFPNIATLCILNKLQFEEPQVSRQVFVNLFRMHVNYELGGQREGERRKQAQSSLHYNFQLTAGN